MDIRLGGTLYVLNGVRNRAFRATVVYADSRTVVVTREDRLGQTFDFDATTLLAEGESWKNLPPILASPDDPLVKVLVARQTHRARHDLAKAKVAAFASAPTVENFVALNAMLAQWATDSIGLDLESSAQDLAAKEVA